MYTHICILKLTQKLKYLLTSTQLRTVPTPVGAKCDCIRLYLVRDILNLCTYYIGIWYLIYTYMYLRMTFGLHKVVKGDGKNLIFSHKKMSKKNCNTYKQAHLLRYMYVYWVLCLIVCWRISHV